MSEKNKEFAEWWNKNGESEGMKRLVSEWEQEKPISEWEQLRSALEDLNDKGAIDD